MNKYQIILIIAFIIANKAMFSQEISNNSEFTVLRGLYLGQKEPGTTPEIFAKGIVSTSKNEHSPAIFSKDGNELFWSYYANGKHVIMYMQQVNGVWTKPVEFQHYDNLKVGNPFFSSDWGKLIFFSEMRGKRKNGSLNIDFWYVEKEYETWSKPKLLDFPPNNEKWQLYGCQVSNGNFYFTSKLDEPSKQFQLYFSKYSGAAWEKAVLMPEIFNSSDVNWTPYVNPDETYMIFSSDRDGNGSGYNACDLFISFKDADNRWSKPINMGSKINTKKIERFPCVSPDNKYLFFVRGFGDIYWVSTSVIKELRPKQ